MRLRVVGFFIVLGALLVACGGGGGKSGTLPFVSQPAPNASASAPPHQATKRMAVTLNIPPANQQSKARRPYFISPNTQSIAFAVVPNGSGTPTPSELQIFPVATPSPCATTGAGGETCTFTVTAPFGTDVFYVATFSVASPNPASSPLANFVSGAIVVASPSPGVSPSPLAFTMNGVIHSVAITVPSPDPNNTPNTQVFAAAVATSVPLGITPFDVSGAPIMTDTFSVPLTISMAPAGVVGLTLNATCPTSTGSTTPIPTIVIGCAADLANATVAYNGTITADSSAHIIDTYKIAASQAASPAPSPATVVLASNITSFAPPGSSGYAAGYLQALPNNTMAYLMTGPSSATSQYGTFDVATGAVLTQTTLNVQDATGFYTMSDGSIYVTTGSASTLLCFAAGSSTPIATTTLSSSMSYASNVTFDGTNLWIAGSTASPSPEDVIAYTPVSATCTNPAVVANGLPGSPFQENSIGLAPRNGGGVLVEDVETGGAWTVATGGAATLLNAGFTPGSAFGGGVGVDGTGAGYFAFLNTNPQGVLFTLANGATSFNASSIALPSTHTGSLAAFGPNNGAADRIGFSDTEFNTLGIVEGPNGPTPVVILANLGAINFGGSTQAVAISTGGAGFAAYENQSTLAINIARTYFTTTWSVPITTLAQGNSPVLGIDERGDSGPFTLTPVAPPACYSGSTVVTGTDHSFFLGNNTSSPCTVTLTISDRNGRSQTVTVTIPGLLT